MGNEYCPELADNHWAQSLGAEWAWEPKTVPRWSSPNTVCANLCGSERRTVSPVCLRVVCKWPVVVLA